MISGPFSILKNNLKGIDIGTLENKLLFGGAGTFPFSLFKTLKLGKR